MVLVGIPRKRLLLLVAEATLTRRHSSGRQKFVIVMLFPLVCTGSLWPTPAGGVMTVRAREGIVTTLPLVHMGGQKSRRRAKRREGDRPPRPAAQTPEATRVDPPDVAAARADLSLIHI